MIPSLGPTAIGVLAGVFTGVFMGTAFGVFVVFLFTRYSCKCKLSKGGDSEHTDQHVILSESFSTETSRNSTLENEVVINMPPGPSPESRDLNCSPPELRVNQQQVDLEDTKSHFPPTRHADSVSMAASTISIGSCLTLESMNSGATLPKFRNDSLNNILEDEASLLSFKVQTCSLKNPGFIAHGDDIEAMATYYKHYDDVFEGN